MYIVGKTKKDVLSYIKQATAITLLVCALCFCLFSFNTTGAHAQIDFNTSQLLEQFIADNPVREAGSIGEQNAAAWLKSYFEGLGLETQTQSFRYEIDQNTAINSNNIIAFLPSNNEGAQTLVLGAHYDSVIAGEGVYDNGSGIAVLIALADVLKDISLPYNVEFVCFGAEEIALVGSNHYASLYSEEKINNTLLMLNFDVISSGDNLYIYGEDISTDICDFFVEKGKQNTQDVSVQKTPRSKDVNMITAGYGIYPYYQTAQASDHSSLRYYGIPTLFFYSGNYNAFGYVERNDGTSIMHTSNDTMEFHQQKLQDQYESKMEVTAQLVYDALCDQSFFAMAQNAKSQLLSTIFFKTWPVAIAVVVIAALCVLFGIRHLNKLKKKAVLEDFDMPKEESFFKPKDKTDDIYDL